MRYPKNAETFTSVFHDFGGIQKMCVRNSLWVFLHSGDIHKILSKDRSHSHMWSLKIPEKLTYGA